jgi:hypothetical protein
MWPGRITKGVEMGEPGADTPAGGEPELAAMVLRSLFSGDKWVASSDTTHLEEVALDWQSCGRKSSGVEIHALLSGAPHGRGLELVGRVAAAGEQFGLAGTCLLEAQRWQRAPDRGPRENMAIRALAEMSGYYATATGHGLVNVTLRTLLLSSVSADAINDIYTSQPIGFFHFQRHRMRGAPSTGTS